jgi:hypothetical protein
VGRVDFERCTLRVEEAIAETSRHGYVKEPTTRRSRRALPIFEPLPRTTTGEGAASDVDGNVGADLPPATTRNSWEPSVLRASTSV